MGYITRNLEHVVSQVTKEYPVVLVTGPRQVGKTTMLQKLMEGTDRDYVTLDDLNERNIAKTDRLEVLGKEKNVKLERKLPVLG